MRMLGTFGLLAALALAGPATAETLRIAGSEATGLTVTTVEADGSVSQVATAAFEGLLAEADGSVRVMGRAQFIMTVQTEGDLLRGARIVYYTQAGRRLVSVTVAIDPCWLTLVNERDFSAEDFGADVREEIAEALPAGVTLEAATARWLEQRLSLLAARMALPLVKSGTVLLPPRS